MTLVLTRSQSLREPIRQLQSKCAATLAKMSATPDSVNREASGSMEGATSSQAIVPDLRSRFPLGTGQGAALTERLLGESAGEEAHPLTVTELAAHTHPYGDYYWYDAGSDSAYSNPGGDEVGERREAARTTGTQGDGTPHNNMPPFFGVHFIMKH